MNVLSFDIEEWYLNYQRSGPKEKYLEYDSYLDTILEVLCECQLTATFFCVGRMGELFPNVIKKIHSQGHEIGCHSNLHTWLNKMTKDECREDTRRAVDSLEQCIGEKVRSYRAPAFSIGVNNKWALETLVENGIDRDASIFPASRSFGGFAHFGQKMPCRVEYNGIKIKEFPICTTTILGKELAYSGGGYFRFFPLHFIKKVMTRSPYVMCYFHIGDLVPESRGIQSKEEYESYFKEKGTVQARYMRYIKANVGKKHALEKMLSLIKEYDYLSLDKADAVIEWDVTPIVRL